MTEPLDTPSVPPNKVDPETLVLRGASSRIVRFRRSAIVAAVLLGSVAVVAVTWVGLSPPTFRGIAAADDRFDPPAPPDELKNAPSNYGEIPKLGPPLPGDLGRPILALQRAVMATEGGATQAEQARMAELERQAAELTAARESKVLLELSGQAARGAGAPVQTATAVTGEPGEDDGSQRRDPDVQHDLAALSRKDAFLTQGAKSEDVNPNRLRESPSPYTLAAGSIISA
jgi:type IV secretory pathway VirB10-like protein